MTYGLPSCLAARTVPIGCPSLSVRAMRRSGWSRPQAARSFAGSAAMSALLRSRRSSKRVAIAESLGVFPWAPSSVHLPSARASLTAPPSFRSIGQRQGERRPLAGHPLRRDQHARRPLLVPGRRLVSPPRDAVEDVVGLLIGAPGGMVGGEVLQEPLGALALRRRKILGESGFVHPSEEVEKAAAELSVELIGRGPLFLRRRCLLRGPAEPRRVIRQPVARVTRVRARYRHEHLPVRERLARGAHVMMMPVPPRRCRLVVGRRRLRPGREGLAEKTHRPQLALRALAQREVLLSEQAHERVEERHSVELPGHLSWLAHLAHDPGTGLPADLSHDVRQGHLLDMQREPAVVVCDLARLPCRERPGREQRRSDNEETTADFTRHHNELLLCCVAGLQSLYIG